MQFVGISDEARKYKASMYLILTAADTETVHVRLDQTDKVRIALAGSADRFAVSVSVVLASSIVGCQTVFRGIDVTGDLSIAVGLAIVCNGNKS